MKSATWVSLLMVVAFGAVAALLAALSGAPDPAATTVPLASPTPTYCPVATPEPLWVDLVTSPTGQFTQVVVVRLGNGEAATITAGSGTFTATGPVGVYSDPASVTVALLTDTTHHLEVFGKVRRVEHDGCIYGGYTLHTNRDKFGAPLVIVQRTNLTHTLHLLWVFRRCCSIG